MLTKFDVITPLDAVDDSNSRSLIGEKSKMSDHSVLICNFDATYSKTNPSVDKNPEYAGKKRRYCFKDLPGNFCNNQHFQTAIQMYITKLETLLANQTIIDEAYTELCELLVAASKTHCIEIYSLYPDTVCMVCYTV